VSVDRQALAFFPAANGALIPFEVGRDLFPGVQTIRPAGLGTLFPTV
jgi:hypothetical protein